MAFASTPELLTLHGVRIKGFTDSRVVGRRFGLDPAQVEELPQDFEAMGWVQRSGFADLTGWSLTGTGRVENERQLAAELTAYDVGGSVEAAHEAFTEENGYFLDTITKWQVRPESWDPMAANDHTDWRWDERVLSSLSARSQALQPINQQLEDRLGRFEGYHDRFAASLARAEHGQKRWVDEPGIDSCHTVWFELHEDLLATLGIERGS